MRAADAPARAVGVGAMAGLAGAAAAHVLTLLADRAGAEAWLRGPYGPQFVPVALYTGIFYGAIGAAAGRRAATAALGFAGTFLGILLPMFVLTRYSGWGMPRGAGSTPQWQLAVVVVYVTAIWGTIAALGAAAGAGRRRGAAAAVLGSLAGYGALALAVRVFSSWARGPWNPLSPIPSPVNLLDGVLSGAGLCLALSLDRRLSRRTT